MFLLSKLLEQFFDSSSKCKVNFTLQSLPIPVAARSKAGSAATRLLGSRVQIPPEAWMSVCCECCVLSGRGPCVGLITRPEESCRVWCV
jgi:hypothetical protein